MKFNEICGILKNVQNNFQLKNNEDKILFVRFGLEKVTQGHKAESGSKTAEVTVTNLAFYYRISLWKRTGAQNY